MAIKKRQWAKVDDHPQFLVLNIGTHVSMTYGFLRPQIAKRFDGSFHHCHHDGSEYLHSHIAYTVPVREGKILRQEPTGSNSKPRPRWYDYGRSFHIRRHVYNLMSSSRDLDRRVNFPIVCQSVNDSPLCRTTCDKLRPYLILKARRTWQSQTIKQIVIIST